MLLANITITLCVIVCHVCDIVQYYYWIYDCWNTSTIIKLITTYNVNDGSFYIVRRDHTGTTTGRSLDLQCFCYQADSCSKRACGRHHTQQYQSDRETGDSTLIIVNIHCDQAYTHIAKTLCLALISQHKRYMYICTSNYCLSPLINIVMYNII